MSVPRSMVAVLLAAALLVTVVGGALAQDDPGASGDSDMARRAPSAHTGYLLAAFLTVWACLWAYLASLHRGQRRLEKLLTRLESSS